MENVELISVTESREESDSWKLKLDGFFRDSVERQMVLDGMSKDAIDTIFSKAASILNHCPNPNVENEISETGVVIGKVQSGKTSNFISLLALAFDNGYGITVVLGGNTLDLLKQNANRIKDAFKVDTDKLTVLKTNDNKSLVNASRIKEFIENGRKIIIVGLKHHNHINQISEIFNDFYLSNKSVLIIDDEGDQATLNTKAYLKSMSTTYEQIVTLKSKLKSHCFLSVTATPQANILIQTFDKLSPDFGELVYPGEGYCGLEEFHGVDCDKRVYVLPEEEEGLLDTSGVPDSIFLAMAMFFVGNAIRRSRGDFDNHALLIHPSQKKDVHDVVMKKIQRVLDDWKEKSKIKLLGVNDLSYASLKNKLLNAYEHFLHDGTKMPPFEDLEFIILNIIKNCSPVHKCNSDENASENSNLYKTNIFVGGNLVERGITIKGLAVTYITRRAKGKSNVDNTEQRARWFGYKEKYIDVCRVFATKSIKDDFTKILEHDDDMWSSIERAQERGIEFKNMPRIFKLQRAAFLNLTRRNVAKTQSFILSEWKSQKYLNYDLDSVKHNDEILNNFKNSFKINNKQYNSRQIHAFISGLNFDQVYNLLLQKLYYKKSEILDKSYFNDLNEGLIKQNLSPIVDVVFMRVGINSKRRIEKNGVIQQLFQGRNPNINSLDYYEGDRSIVNECPNNIQIQIHYVQPTNIPEISYFSPIIAIYIPEWCANKLSELVVRKND